VVLIISSKKSYQSLPPGFTNSANIDARLHCLVRQTDEIGNGPQRPLLCSESMSCKDNV